MNTYLVYVEYEDVKGFYTKHYIMFATDIYDAENLAKVHFEQGDAVKVVGVREINKEEAEILKELQVATITG